ncbi:MAG: SH3 domain-containing protein [Streptomycetaceae bacterium]|nr:SH3 domain-containing protein [Streptomycetaceae bacterium]
MLSTAKSRTSRRSSKTFARLGLAAASALLLTGGAVAVAPTASAASHPSCTKDFRDFQSEINTGNVRLRATNGTVLRLLQKGANVTVYCARPAGEAEWWWYVKHNSSGQKGWVWWGYVG